MSHLSFSPVTYVHDFKIMSHLPSVIVEEWVFLIYFLLSICKAYKSKVPCHEHMICSLSHCHLHSSSSLSIQLVPAKVVLTPRQTDNQVESWSYCLKKKSINGKWHFLSYLGVMLRSRDGSYRDHWWASTVWGRVWSYGFFSRSRFHSSYQVQNSLPWASLDASVSVTEPWVLGHYKLIHSRTFKEMSVSKSPG